MSSNTNNDTLHRKELDHALIVQAQNGDKDAREELVERHINLIRNMVNNYSQRHHTFEDLVQEGVCGLLMAIDRFDVSRDVQFSTYAVHYIRSNLTTATTQGVPKDMRTRKVYFQAGTVAEHIAKTGTSPTVEDIAHQLDVDPSYVMSVHNALLPTMEYEDVSADSSETVEDRLIREDEVRQLRKAISKLPQQEYTVIQRRFKNEHGSLRSAGDNIGLSGERARQIENSAIKRLKLELLKI